ncbi:MAG TPA: hypothetical protein VIM99_11925 [Blastocatellia bacterium]
MKNFKKWFTMAALAAVLFPLTGFAQGINERQRNQRERIRQGVRSGELTRVEAARLRRQQARIGLMEARARRSGGEFTLRERARIQRQLNRSSRAIYRQKHDRQDRYR